MNIVVCKDYEQMCRQAATVVSARILRKPNVILGFPTGSTPEGMYAQLVRMHREEGIDWREVTTFNLDEYVGLPPEHDQSYRYFMNRQLFDHVNIPKSNTHLLNGCAADLQSECQRYEDAIARAGGIDLQVLGIGRNGHIGFNEPATAFSPMSVCESLTQDTINVNARLFANLSDVPKTAITMGIGSIMRAREILLLANGSNKTQAVKEMITGAVAPRMPASILQFHQSVTILLDQEAAAML